MNSQSDQNMERSRQVIHWEIRKAQTGRFLGAQGRSEGQELGNPEEQSTAPNERLKLSPPRVSAAPRLPFSSNVWPR